MRHILLGLLLLSVGSSKSYGGEKQNNDKVIEVYQNPGAYPQAVLVAAHRGNWRNAPENSLLAMDFCIKYGIDIMETDLKMTKDGVLVLFHDSTLDRTTTGSGNVADWTLDSLKTLYLKNGLGVPTSQRIPTFEEGLIHAEDRIMLDLDKSYPYFGEAYDMVKQEGMLDQVIFRINDSYEDFSMKYGELIKGINYMPLLWWNTEDPKGFVDSYIHAPYPPKAIEIIFGEDRTDLLDQVDRIKSKGIGIMMNPIYPHIAAGRLDDLALSNPDDNWGWVIENGATVIGTDRPVLLMDYLEDTHNRGFSK